MEKYRSCGTGLDYFLADNGGFYLYYYDRNSFIYKIIQIQDGFVEEVTTEHIKKFIKNYILSLPETFDNTSPGVVGGHFKITRCSFFKGYLRVYATNISEYTKG